MLSHIKFSRSYFCRVLLLALCSLITTAAFADDRAAIRSVVNDFYKNYPSAKDPEKFIAKSSGVTPGLKAAYAAYMKREPDSDPIIGGQDVPRSGYHAGEISLDAKGATVTMVTQDKGFSPLKVYVVAEGKHWLINGVNKLRAK